MKRALLAIFSFLFSSSVWASVTIAPAVSADPFNYTPASDLSLHYLSDLFGNVPGILNGTGSGMAGQLFQVLNEGILVVAGIWIVFTTFKILLSAGLDGTIHGPQKKWTMVIFRIVLGLSLLIPGSSGYSVSQDLMMKVVIEGVHLADDTWSYALNYLHDGGMLFSVPNDSTQSYAAYAYYLHDSESNATVQQVLRDEVRMYASNHYNQNPSSPDRTKAAAGQPYSPIFVPPQVVSNNQSFTVTLAGHRLSLAAGRYLLPGFVLFPGVGNAPPYSVQNLSANSGAIVAYPGTVVRLAGNQNAQIMHYQESYAALHSLVAGLLPVARQEVDAVFSAGSTIVNPTTEGMMVATSVVSYVHLMTPYIRSIQDGVKSTSAKFISNAQAEGWSGAGSFYWDLANLNDAMQGALKLSGYVPRNYSFSSLMPSAAANQINTAVRILEDTGLNSVYIAAEKHLHQILSNTAYGTNSAGHSIYGNGPFSHSASGGAAVKNAFLSTYEPATLVNTSFDTGGADFGCVIQNALTSVVQTVASIELSGELRHAFYDPLIFVDTVGRSCLSAAGGIWADSIAWLLGVAAVSGVCTAVNPGGTVLNAMISWVSPIWQAAAAALFTAGFMLTFYAPLYPYLLFTFGVIGWMIYVLEAMVAAPLVAFGMTHPEGDDYIGRAEQALMLALGVFLRPALMVVGFITAMMMSYIGFSIINFSLGSVLEESTGHMYASQGTNILPAIWTVVNGGPFNPQASSFTGHDLSDFLLIPLLMVGYGLVVIEVVNQCFSLIHVLPDMVLRWIGGPVQQDQSERYAGQIQSGLSGAARQGAQTAGQAATGFGSFMGSQFVEPASQFVATAAIDGGADAMSEGGSDGGGDGGAAAGGADAEEAAMLLV